MKKTWSISKPGFKLSAYRNRLPYERMEKIKNIVV